MKQTPPTSQIGVVFFGTCGACHEESPVLVLTDSSLAPSRRYAWTCHCGHRNETKPPVVMDTLPGPSGAVLGTIVE